MVEPCEIRLGGARVQTQNDTGQRDLALVIAQGFVELLLAGYPLGKVELAPDPMASFKQRDLMPALCGNRRAGQPGRAGADHGDASGCFRRGVKELGLGAGTRVDQAAGALVGEHVVQAGLIAGDAGVDLVTALRARLGHPLRVGQQRACH